jgi:hypothetical protein
MLMHGGTYSICPEVAVVALPVPVAGTRCCSDSGTQDLAAQFGCMLKFRGSAGWQQPGEQNAHLVPLALWAEAAADWPPGSLVLQRDTAIRWGGWRWYPANLACNSRGWGWSRSG